jgi:pSer/pThr/pTyr-binding forkhead associated (FHA) protein
MDVAAHYRQLVELGKDEFVAAVAPAALLRYRHDVHPELSGLSTLTLDETSEDTTLPISKEELEGAYTVEIHPLAKKPGASFADRITIGRTPNNDIAINEHSVSRLHAYVRADGPRWVVADAGSKNGTSLRGKSLEPRKERPLLSHAVIRIGEIELTFFVAEDLFEALRGL